MKATNFTEALQTAFDSCATPFYKHKKKMERKHRGGRRHFGYYREPTFYVKPQRDYLFEVFPKAYEFASDNGKFMPMERQFYYVVRKRIQDQGCEKELQYGYFEACLKEWEDDKGKRMCAREAVGSLSEPHTDKVCHFGTGQVLEYVVPGHCFNKVLYIEKRGFMDQLIQENIHHKYDVAIAAGAGFATDAAKELFAKIEQKIDPIRICCFHDADGYGVNIARRLGKLRFTSYEVDIVDLGLKPQEAVSLGLPVEHVALRKSLPHAIKSRVTIEEWKWLKDGNRVELNAFTPREFVEWVEGKLQTLDVPQKVIPKQGVIDEYIKDTYSDKVDELVKKTISENEGIQGLIKRIHKYDKLRVSPKDIGNAFKKDCNMSWKDVADNQINKDIIKRNIVRFINESLQIAVKRKGKNRNS